LRRAWLGGGLGILGRKHALIRDHLIGVQIVLADGCLPQLKPSISRPVSGRRSRERNVNRFRWRPTLAF
jgi:FAD/FMN-containing dehydrogenase